MILDPATLVSVFPKEKTELATHKKTFPIKKESFRTHFNLGHPITKRLLFINICCSLLCSQSVLFFSVSFHHISKKITVGYTFHVFYVTKKNIVKVCKRIVLINS